VNDVLSVLLDIRGADGIQKLFEHLFGKLTKNKDAR
jgi:hypothetical protein